MDDSASGTRRQGDETPWSLSPLNAMSNSTNISQSELHRATTAPTLQARPPYATMANKALSDEGFDDAAGSSSGATSRRREPRPTDNQTTARPAAASRGRQATTEQFDVKPDPRSRAGKSPLDADNTQNVSAHNTSSSKPSSIFSSKETRAAQREGITNSATPESETASSMQLPAHLVTNSPPSWNAPPSQALPDNSSNTFLPVMAPRPEEVGKTNESHRSQEDSRSQRTVTRPQAEHVGLTASVQSFAKPSASYPPPSSSSERRPNTSYAEKVDPISSIQLSAQPSVPSSPHFLFSERNVTRSHADPVDPTTSSSIQPLASVKPPAPHPPSFPSSGRNATEPHAEPVNHTAPVQPPAKPSIPSPPSDRPTTSVSPSPSPPAPVLPKMASNQTHSTRGMHSHESQAQIREVKAPPPPPPSPPPPSLPPPPPPPPRPRTSMSPPSQPSWSIRLAQPLLPHQPTQSPPPSRSRICNCIRAFWNCMGNFCCDC